MMRVFLLLLLALSFLPFQANAKKQDDLNMLSFSTLPVLHAGRVKPLDSFARVMLKSFSGKDPLEEQSASQWLAESLFDPAAAVEKPLFKIFDGEKLGLPENDTKLYSYMEVARAVQSKEETIKTLLDTSEASWTAEQKNLITLYDNFILYTQILRSLTLILPLDTDADNKSVSFLDYEGREKEIDRKVKDIIRRKGTDLAKYTDKEKELAALSYQLRLLQDSSRNNVLLRIIPENFTKKDSNWLSPWSVKQQDKSDADKAAYLDIWKNMASAYRNHDAPAWIKETNAALKTFPAQKLKAEIIYNKLNLIGAAEKFYLMAFVLLIAGSLLPKFKTDKAAFIALAIGLAAHGIHIALRVYILGRPPVGTLYESILFVSLITVGGLALFALWQRTSTGTLLGSICGIILLVTAQGFTGDDTMSTLVAVLNTNFWLGTHVLCISAGYGLCLITSLMSHYYLGQKFLNKKPDEFYAMLLRNLKTLSILALLFTTIGTILGGIWADQSWGRFWGWDPKENGALLIVIWLIWLLHGRISRHISDNGFVVGGAFLSIVVVLAWFGVNLLNVGLHSYGFISGVAMGIGIFCAAEVLVIGGLWYGGKRKAIA